MSQVEITYQASWRMPSWDERTPSRPAWFVNCPQHPHLGRNQYGERWGYTARGIAQAVASRHERSSYHR